MNKKGLKAVSGEVNLAEDINKASGLPYPESRGEFQLSLLIPCVGSA